MEITGGYLYSNMNSAASKSPSAGTPSHFNFDKSVSLIEVLNEKAPHTDYKPVLPPPASEYDYSKVTGPIVSEEFLIWSRQRTREEYAIWDARQQGARELLSKRVESDVEAVKKSSPTPRSIFDNKEVSQEVKDYLADKPMTAVRYQRLYEQDPRKAQLFLDNIKAYGQYTLYDMDEKYKGWEYTEVLKHVNALLEVNYRHLSEGGYRYANYLQKVFNIDDQIGVTYSAIWKKPNEGIPGTGFDTTPIDDDMILDLDALAAYEERFQEDRELSRKGLMKIRLHEPIGVEKKHDYSITVEENKVYFIDPNYSPDFRKRSLDTTKICFYGTIY